MAQLQCLPGDPRLVDQLVYELKSKGIFDQFRKECIADVDTRPAYQNLRQRVEGSVASFLSRQCWKPDLNKNQLREKLRKHLLDGNYLEQGVERIVDQVVNPKVASVFIPQVEDVVYNYLGIPRKKAEDIAETSNGKDGVNDLLPTDLEAVSPGSVKSNEDKSEELDVCNITEDDKMEIDVENCKSNGKEDLVTVELDNKEKMDCQDSRASIANELPSPISDIDKSSIPLPYGEINLENIPAPDNSPPNVKDKNIDLEKIHLPNEPNLSTDIPLPDEMPKVEAEPYIKATAVHSDDDDTSSDSSLRRNMSPLTPIRNFNNENSYDAQQAFENITDSKNDDIKEPSSFRFTIESKSSDNSTDGMKTEKKDPEQLLSYQFNSQVNITINTFNTPLYDDSSNSNNLQIDYESDANSKVTTEVKLPEPDQNSGDFKKERKSDDKKSSHKSSHKSRDSHRHTSSKDKRSDSKHSSSRDSSRHTKKSSKDDHKSKSSHKEKPTDPNEKKDSRDSSKHRSSHKSSSSKDSKHRSSSTSKHSSSSKHDDKKSSSSSSHRDKDRSTDKSRDKTRDSKSSSHRSDKDKDRKSSSKSKHEEKDNKGKEKKDKKDSDDHYSLSGRGNPNRRSTDRDSNDGSSSSKGSHNPSSSKLSESKKDNKGSSKSDNTSTSGDSTSPSDKDVIVNDGNYAKNVSQCKPVVRVETHLEMPFASPPRLPFVPDVTLKKPRFAANLEEAKRMVKMRKFLEEEQKRMNQEAALLLEFQANVRPSLSQVYSNIPGPELEFACISNSVQPIDTQLIGLEETLTTEAIQQNTFKINDVKTDNKQEENVKKEHNNTEAKIEIIEEPKDAIAETLIAMHLEQNVCTRDVSQHKNTEEINITEPVVDANKNKETESIIAALSGNVEENKSVVVTNNDEVASHCKIEQSAVLEPKIKVEEKRRTEHFEITIITEKISEPEALHKPENEHHPEHINENLLHYFGEHEKYNAELERDQFSKFFNTYYKGATNKMYLINCDTYEENLIKEVSESFGNYEIVNYHKNGHLKLSTPVKNVVKNLNVATEITLPTKPDFEANFVTHSPVFSPVKSECSFELSSDYDAKLEEMVNRTSRQEIMEIILGSVLDESCRMPQIDYCMDSRIESETNSLKRKMSEVESNMNNNRHVLTPNKMRKLSDTDQISSTTEAVPNSPSSDKSVENYEETPTYVPNGKVKAPRKVQRYDTSDLYKPKLHYLSRRNNIS